MLKPFYNKKKNIDDRLVPAVSAADAGKVLGVTEDGKIAAVEGGGGSQLYCHLIRGFGSATSFNYTVLINDDPEEFTLAKLYDYLTKIGCTNNKSNWYPQYGDNVQTTGAGSYTIYIMVGVKASNRTNIIRTYVEKYTFADGSLTDITKLTDEAAPTIYDTVTPLN